MMDTSKRYIAMCDCPEMQEPWRRKHYSTREQDVYWDSEGHVSYVSPFQNSTWNRITTGSIWLPRQDQLQEMVFNRYDGYRWLIIDFARWVGDFEDTTSASVEQLWLSFVMHELYGKCWVGRGWWIDES